jgi:hypothetical protein
LQTKYNNNNANNIVIIIIIIKVKDKVLNYLDLSPPSLDYINSFNIKSNISFINFI